MNLFVEQINEAIKELADGEKQKVSDGYHTFEELYDHRCAIFVALCNNHPAGWKSKLHSDGTMFDGWFIAGLWVANGVQITYHLPVKLWTYILAQEFEKAPEWDGHTPADVITRLLNL